MNSNIIEEYKTLREEVLLHIRMERQILALSGTVFFVVVAFLSKAGVSPSLWGVLLMALITPIFLLYREEVCAIAKIASYIHYCIEPRVEGLEWAHAHIDAIPKYGKDIFIRPSLELSPSRVIGAYFLVLLAVSWALPFIKDSHMSPGLAVVMSVLSAVYLINFVCLLRYRQYREKWDTIWQKSFSERHGNDTKK